MRGEHHDIIIIKVSWKVHRGCRLHWNWQDWQYLVVKEWILMVRSYCRRELLLRDVEWRLRLVKERWLAECRRSVLLIDYWMIYWIRISVLVTEILLVYLSRIISDLAFHSDFSSFNPVSNLIVCLTHHFLIWSNSSLLLLHDLYKCLVLPFKFEHPLYHALPFLILRCHLPVVSTLHCTAQQIVAQGTAAVVVGFLWEQRMEHII